MHPPNLLPFATKGGSLSILPLADLHLPKPSISSILTNRAYLDRMDYIVLLGDQVKTCGTDDEYRSVTGFIDELKRPYVAVTGNHEWQFQTANRSGNDSRSSGLIQGGYTQQQEMLKKFLHFYQMDCLWHAFTNELGKFIFLSINASKIAPTIEGIKIPHLDQCEALSSEQLDFFEFELQTAFDKPVFVFCHAPVILSERLDLVYYDKGQSGCIEVSGALRKSLLNRDAPTYWVSGHLHIHPDHYLSKPYRINGNVWQVHCPDSWGSGRWLREHSIPQRYEGLFSKHLEIDFDGVTITLHNHQTRKDIRRERIENNQ